MPGAVTSGAPRAATAASIIASRQSSTRVSAIFCHAAVAQFSLLKYQLKPQIGCTAISTAVSGRPARINWRTRAMQRVVLEIARHAAAHAMLGPPSHRALAPALLDFRASDREACDARPARSIGRVTRCQAISSGYSTTTDSTSAATRSPSVAAAGVTMPSHVHSASRRPT